MPQLFSFASFLYSGGKFLKLWIFSVPPKSPKTKTQATHHTLMRNAFARTTPSVRLIESKFLFSQAGSKQRVFKQRSSKKNSILKLQMASIWHYENKKQ